MTSIPDHPSFSKYYEPELRAAFLEAARGALRPAFFAGAFFLEGAFLVTFLGLAFAILGWGCGITAVQETYSCQFVTGHEMAEA
jgi:hypothetical protein